MRKYSIVLPFILLLLSLTGCTVEADRVYVVCRKTADTTYVFSGSKEFYTYDGEQLYPCIDPNLQPYPALQFNIEDGEYNLAFVLPGLYRGTLTSLEHYVYKVCNGDSSKITVISADWQELELLLTLDNIDMRILYNIHGDIRIYSSNNSAPLYLNEK